MRLMITGASGLLGSHLAHYFLEKGSEVFGTHASRKITIDQFNTDSLAFSPEKILEYLTRNKPNVVIHCAAATNVDWCQKNIIESNNINVIGTDHLARECNRLGIKLVYISTPTVFGSNSPGQIIKIEDKKAPVNFYSQSKLTAEKLVLNYPINCVVRLNPFGRSPSSNHLLDWSIINGMSGSPLNGFVDCYFNPIFAGNVGKYLHRIIEKNSTGIFHLGCKNSVSKFEFISSVLKNHEISCKVYPRKIHEIKKTKNKAERNLNNVIDLSCTEERLGAEFQSFDKELKDFLKFRNSKKYCQFRVEYCIKKRLEKTWVVIPAKNEEKTILRVLEKLRTKFDNIVVVDDGSSDSTVDLVLQNFPEVKIVSCISNLGYDGAIGTGMQYCLEAGAELILTFDADGQHLVEDAVSLVKEIKGFDFVLGVRDHKPRISEHLFSIFLKKIKVSDPLCGMKLYRAKLLKNSMFFDTINSIGTELVVHSILSGYQFKEVKIKTENRLDTSRFGRKLVANIKITKALYRVCKKYWRQIW